MQFRWLTLLWHHGEMISWAARIEVEHFLIPHVWVVFYNFLKKLMWRRVTLPLLLHVIVLFLCCSYVAISWLWQAILFMPFITTHGFQNAGYSYIIPYFVKPEVGQICDNKILGKYWFWFWKQRNWCSCSRFDTSF